MSLGINKTILLGHLGADPEKVAGSDITKITVATTERWKDKTSGETKEKTEWHRVTFFGHLANSAAKWLYKGAKVYIEGKNVTNKWNKDGQDHYTTEIHVKSYQLLSGIKDGEAAPAQQKHQEDKSNGYQPQQGMAGSGFDDDIPL